MKSAILVSAVFAAGALASPVDGKRAVVTATKVDVVVETVWVTVDGPSPTPVVHQHHTPHIDHNTGVPDAPAASPAPQESATPATGNSPPSAQGASDAYQSTVLIHHNLHRANHSAPPLTWSDDMASIAQTEAQVCNFAHNLKVGGGGYGQNIAAGSSPDQIASVISDEFYNGEVNNYAGYYGMANPPFGNFEHWGHFSQVVWKGTQSVGCATVHCGHLGSVGGGVAPYFTVCNYSPAGNMGGEYGANVGEPLGEPTITGNDYPY